MYLGARPGRAVSGSFLKYRHVTSLQFAISVMFGTTVDYRSHFGAVIVYIDFDAESLQLRCTSPLHDDMRIQARLSL